MHIFKATRVFSLLLICLAALICEVAARILRWRQDTNFATPTNWDSGHVPCSNERVVFPQASPVVYIQNNVVASEIVLPSDGQLIFADGSSISIPSSVDTESCPQRDVHYVGGSDTNTSWFDSRNWCEVSQEGGRCLDPQPPRLSLEKLPCDTDTAVFPSDSSFLVQLHHSIDIHIGALNIAHKDFDTLSFRDYLKSDMGRKLFRRTNSSSEGSTPTTITISGSTCGDKDKGCPCANVNDPALKEKVCQIERARCAQVTCENTLTPTSHCCPICGAILLVEYGSQTRLQPLENLAKKMLQQQAPGSEVKTIVSKLPDGEHFQIVVLDDGTDKAMEVAEEIKKQLERDMEDKKKYGVLGVTVQMSGYSSPSAHGHTGEEGGEPIKMINVVMICLALIILMVILAITIYCTSQHRRPIKDIIGPKVPDFIQRTLESRRKRTEELELSRSVSTFNNNVIFESGAAGFDNPNFGQGLSPPEEFDQSTSQNRYIPAGAEEMQPDFHVRNGSFENPLYGEKSVAAQVHSARQEKTVLDDNVTLPGVKSDFPQRTSRTEVKPGGGPRILDRLRRHKHQKMEEDEDADVSNVEVVSSVKKVERKKKESTSSHEESEEEHKVDSEKPMRSSERRRKEKDSRSGRVEGVGEVAADSQVPPEPKQVSHKLKRPKLPTSAKSGMHEKLVDSSDSTEDDKDVNLGATEAKEEQEVKEEGKKDKQRKKKKKKERSSDFEGNRGGFSNPLYALEEAERKQKAAEEARKRLESKSEPSEPESRLIELEDSGHPGESTA